MRSRFMIKLRDESGVAMLVVLFAVIVVSVMGSALVISAVRDLESSISVQRSSTALGIAEAGVQHAIAQLREKGPIAGGIAKCVQDESADGGWGQWMHPTDKTLPPFFDPNDPNAASTNPNSRPTNCGPYVGHVGLGRYTAYIVGDSAESLIKLPERRVGTYRVDAEGFDRRDNPGRPGERTVEQNLRVETVAVPFSLFAKTQMDLSGTPTVFQESIYTEGNISRRDLINFQAPSPLPADCPYPEGCDLYYGWNAAEGKCSASPAAPNAPCPVAANAAGSISDQFGDIHPPRNAPPGPAEKADDCKYAYDRDKNTRADGSTNYNPYNTVTGDWGKRPSQLCNNYSTPKPIPPFNNWKFTAEDMPFSPDGPSEEVYQLLKQIAQSNGTYCTHSSGTLRLPPSSGNPSCQPLSDTLKDTPVAQQGFQVFYIDVIGTPGPISFNAGWGPQTRPPQTHTPCSDAFGILVVRNGNVDWQGVSNGVWWGSAFVPEGHFNGSGIGDAWFVGTVYADRMTLTGNLKFQLNDCWLDAVASPAFFLVNRLRWHERDR